MLSQRPAQELRSSGRLDGLPQIARQRLNAQPPPFLIGQGRHVGFRCRGQRERLLRPQPVQPGCQDDAEGEIRVAGRVGRAQLQAERRLLSRLGAGNPEKVRPVGEGPGDVDRRLVPRDQPLVGVHPLVGDSRERPHVAQDPREEPPARLGQPVGIRGMEESVLLAAEEGDVHVHAGAVLPRQRLRHEGGVDAVLEGDLLDDQPVGHHVVRRGQGIGVAEVDLMLGRGHLVVGKLHPHPQLLHGEDRLAPKVGRHIQRSQVKVAAGVQRLRLLGRPEIEMLQLRADVEGVAQIRRLPEVALQDVAGIPLERLAAGVDDVAEHPGHRVLAGPPWKDGEGVGVRQGHHVGFLRPRESLHRGAVEAHPLLQRLLQLLDGDGDVLEGAKDVGEPEADELDPQVAGGLEDVLLILQCRGRCGHGNLRGQTP